jgi:hypothetical protein
MSAMPLVTVSTEVDHDPDDVYAFLDVMGNHERINDHLLTDWSYSGPPTGLGARAEAMMKLAGRRGPVEMEVVETTVATTIVHRYVSHRGLRVSTGTYRIARGAQSGARVTYEYAVQREPGVERVATPLVRALMRRALRRSLDRLAEVLAENGR